MTRRWFRKANASSAQVVLPIAAEVMPLAGQGEQATQRVAADGQERRFDDERVSG